MVIMSLIDTVLSFLLFSSVMLFALGVLSTLIIKILKIQGRPKLWICTLLIIMPLAYPLKALFPDHLKISVPVVTFQSYDAPYAETSSGNHPASDSTTPNMIGESAPGSALLTDAKSFQREASGILSPAATPDISPFGLNWKAAAATLWGVIFLLFITRLIWMVKQTGRLLRLADPVTNPQVVRLFRQCVSETGMRRSPRLLILDNLPAPMVIGLLHPAVLLPGRLLASEFREGLRFALLHELKHIHRHHNWWLLIESLVSAAYFFHPVIYWARKKIREEWEYMCDKHVVQVTRKSISYADFLLHEIWKQTRGVNPALALPFFSGMAKTTNRIRSILENSRPTPFSEIRGRIAVALILLSFVSILVCSGAPSAQEPSKVISGTNADLADISAEISGEYTVQAEAVDPAIKADEPGNALDPLPDSPGKLPLLNRDNDLHVDTTGKDDNPERVISKEVPLEKDNTPVAIPENPVAEVQDTLPQVHETPGKLKISDTDTSIRSSARMTGSENKLLLAQNHEPAGAGLQSAPPVETRAEKYLGPPEDGIHISRIKETRVLDDQTILFIMRGGDLYLNRLPVRCPGLYMGNGFSYNTFSSDRLTRFDRIRVISHGNFPGSTGMLGDFIPFRYEGKRSDAIRLLKNGLLDELAAEGAFEEAFSD